MLGVSFTRWNHKTVGLSITQIGMPRKKGYPMLVICDSNCYLAVIK